MFMPGYNGSDPQADAQSFTGVVREWSQNQGWVRAKEQRVQQEAQAAALAQEAALLAGTVDSQLQKPLADIAQLQSDMELMKALIMAILNPVLPNVIPGDAQ